ncbi:MAG: hypothetical protein AAFV31_08530 [Pseudomonadota bacterium]
MEAIDPKLWGYLELEFGRGKKTYLRRLIDRWLVEDGPVFYDRNVIFVRWADDSRENVMVACGVFELPEARMSVAEFRALVLGLAR